MNKETLLKSITKEMKIIRRLSTKIPTDQINFRPKEGMRSSLELLQYLGFCGTAMILYWYKNEDSDFRTFFGGLRTHGQNITHENFISTMDAQITLVNQLFEKITEVNATATNGQQKKIREKNYDNRTLFCSKYFLWPLRSHN